METRVREQRPRIENMHNHLLNEIAARQLNVSGVSKLRLRPAIVMSVEEEILKYLLVAPFVDRITLEHSTRTRSGVSSSIINVDEVYNSIGNPYVEQMVVIIDG